MNIYQSDTHRKDWSWLHFSNETRVQERQQVKDQQSYISVFVACLTIPIKISSTSPDMTTVFHAWLYGRFIGIQSNLRRKSLHRTNQGSNCLGGSFCNRDDVRASIQFWTETQPKHLKRWFFLKDRSIHLHINSTSVIRPVNQNQLKSLFPVLKSTSHFLPQSTVSRTSNSSSEANSSYCHRSDAWSHLE